MNKKYLAKIIAQDESGIQMISALASEAKVKISGIKYLPKNNIFLLSMLRFSKEKVDKNKKIHSILKFEFINSCRAKNINQNEQKTELEVLTIDIIKNKGQFEIKLVFLNDKIIDLKSEIIECKLEDQNEVI
mgnify:CR=1 FL=1|jgi:hypothetical protein|tara:strand:- start:53 stop:448 length:396 start_codon:yes stop_codon:yes gene_type:complete